MSKFDKLSALAVQKAEGFQALHKECTLFANSLVCRLREYFEAPPNMIVCQEVNRALETVGRPSALPTLCFCYDAYWYFLLNVRFSYPGIPLSVEGLVFQANTLVGIKKLETGTGSVFAVKLPGVEFQIANTDEQAKFCEHVFNDLQNELVRPWTQEQRTFGFVPPTKG